MKMLTVLDLFSGIGAFSLGLERAGMRTISFCEIDPFCRRVLAKHWPEVRCYQDVRELSVQHLTADGHSNIDIICGGFPCQDISTAGSGAGIDAAQSGLWREFARLIGELRPRYVIVENSPMLLHRGLGDVLGDLAALGYDAEWSILSACRMDAPHTRERLFLVAYPDVDGLEAIGGQGDGNDAAPRSRRVYPRYIQEAAISVGGTRGHSFASEPDVARVAHGVADRVDRNHAIGNAVLPQIPELIGRAIMAAERATADV